MTLYIESRNMKKTTLLLILFFSLTSFAQNFEKSWSKVIDLENDGKLKSANHEVELIYQKAISSQNETQLIKCFFYKSKYLQSLEEDSQAKIIANLEHEITKVSIPSKAILELVYAKCLNSYLKENDYKLYNRTKTDTTQSSNFLTWTLDDFKIKIEDAYQQTLSNELVLKNTFLQKYEPIFDFFIDEKSDTMSLFDYMLQENIEYYCSKLNQSENYNLELKLNSDLLLSNNELFNTLKVDTLKNENLKKVITLFQQNDYSSNGSEKELNRLLLCNTYILKKDTDLLKSLNNFQRNNTNKMVLQNILYEKATLYNKLANKDTNADYKVKAVAALDSILVLKKRTNAFKKASELKRSITQKELSIELQKNWYENENTRGFIEYRNITNIKISFYKINSGLDFSTTKKDSLFEKIISKTIAYKTQNYCFLDKKNYFTYTTEIAFPQLELGFYLIVIEDLEESISVTKKIFKIINVTNNCVLAFQKNNKAFYQIINRKTGNPIKDCIVKSDAFALKSDENGIVEFYVSDKEGKYLEYQNITVINQKDTLLVNRSYYRNDEDYDIKNQKTNVKVNFYLDRAIYRPGQTVYYKGIAVQNVNGENKVLPNLLLRILVEDANYDEVKSLEVTTNEFGSFSGDFIIPKNGITGNFSIEAEEPDDITKDILYDKIHEEHPIWDNVNFENSDIRFKVEEYKRPKFEIVFEPTKDDITLNQNVTVKGKVTSFSGSAISDAKVIYSIECSSYSKNGQGIYNEEKNITSSETKTNANGSFSIDFKSTPPIDTSKNKNIILNYTIKATVTDINGETHTNETYINAGYKTLKLNVNVPKNLISNEKNTINFFSKNLNNQFTAINGDLKVYFIKNFEKKFKTRNFDKPEITSITNEEFERLYPFENNESQIDPNEQGTLIYSKKINTEKETMVTTDFLSSFKSGHYKLVFSATDKFNNLIESTAYFQLHQINDKEFNGNDLITIRQLNENPKLDGYVLIQINSAVPQLFLSCSAIFNNQTFFEKYLFLSNNKTELKIPIQQGIKDFFKIGIETVYENEHFVSEKDIYLKEETPKLTVEVESFRDKLEPGKLEKWSFKITENDKKAEAEILASMYDISLDQFVQSNWAPLYKKRYYSNRFLGKTSLGFENTNGYFVNNTFLFTDYDLQNETTKLMWFGFDFTNSNSYKVIKDYKRQITKKARKPKNAKLISGFLSDGKLPLPGASIIVKGTKRGVSTDMDGYYEIEAAKGEELVFSYVGFISKSILIEKSKIYNITLIEDSNVLSEVVVGAMGIKRNKDAVVSAQKQISFKELVQSSNPNAIQSLQGKITGLQITTVNEGSNSSTKIVLRGNKSITGDNQALIVIDGVILNADVLGQMSADSIADINVLKGAQGAALYGAQGANGVIIVTTKKGIADLTQVKTRTNHNETAFFFPHLRTDKEGKTSFSFTTPEELSQWKFRLLAHNKNATEGYFQKTAVTQKELMVFPNMPRFFREKDTIVISSKITNMTPDSKVGNAILQLFDASTMKNIDLETLNSNSIKNFTIMPSGNTVVNWKITIPEGIQGIQYKVIAKSGNYSDGEENIVPVLTNTILVTESLPLWVKGNSKKEYAFNNLKNNSSTTLRNHLFTLEYTSNPTWIAIQSLPYLVEYEHECAEQTFAKFYGNILASELINSNPKIGKLFDDWKKSGKSISKLEQNEALKSLILAESPWMIDNESEDEKHKKLSLLFDLETMRSSTLNTFNKLKEKQKASGGFAWFDGGNENENITSHIVAGLGHLQKLKVDNKISDSFAQITKTAILFLDTKYSDRNSLSTQKTVYNSDLYYLYTRSFYLKSYPISNKLNKIITMQLENIATNWKSYSLYEKGLAALILYRFDEIDVSNNIIESLKESASTNDDWGMYWIENKSGYSWFQASIETQALLIEAFLEITNDTKSVDAMKVWLLKNKQTKNWPSTKSTTEAIYALLMQGTDWTSIKDNTVIKIGDEKILTQKLTENEKEAETGYIKMNWKTNEISPNMASISIENKSKSPGYGGVYWQYFEDLDKVKTNVGTNLSTSKELYLKRTSNTGEELIKINAKNPLKLGDLITVRLIITAKEDMDYVHLKDMRASCFEPVNVLSQYQWKDNLGFYMSTKDASTHFFFDTLNKGTYVLEYDIRVNNVGDFSNGITTIESMYAPEYTSHTKGIRVNVKE